MKKSIIQLTVLMLLVASTMQSCTKSFVELNTSPNDSENAYPHQFMANVFIDAVAANMSRNRSFNNELMQVTVAIGDGEGKVFRYDFRRNWGEYLWNAHYININNFKEMYKQASKEVTLNTSYQGIALLGQSWLFSILTDMYGDVPYTQAGLGLDSLLLEPKFDKQKDIYMGIFTTLDSVNSLFKANQPIEATHDPIYAGDVSRWRKFSNSLFLRLLIRASAKAETQDYVLGKIKEILETNKSNYPIIASNDDSAILRWTDEGYLLSPFKGTRVQDFRATALSEFYIDYLRDTNDPRINIPVYGTGSVNRMGIAPVSGNYIGVPSGYSAGGEDYSKMSYFYSYDQNNGVNSLQTEPLTGSILSFAEVEFMKAEAVLKGWVSGDVESLFYSGVLNNIQLWIPDYQEDIVAHLSASDRAWDESKSFEDKMEAIHLQKYHALFMVDMQQWYEYRRTGHPVLPKGPGLKNDGKMPARMYYPVYIQSANPTSYKNAIAVQGPDDINTQVWWQKP